MYKTNAANITDAQIESQITVLTEDFRKNNGDVGTAPSVYQSLVADSRIEFALATTDPAGDPTNGIVRVKTKVDSFLDDDAVKSAATGGSDAWPADKYLNIWVCELGGGLLGYAQFPGGPAATDGVVILHTAFGTTGTAAAPFNKGRTATHEVGHWLNLRHIWGDDGTGCAGSDLVADTPNQAGPNYGTPPFPTVSCNNGPNGDMFMNYMDYVDDIAMVMFTTGQVTRMQAALDGPRSSIGVSIPCASVVPPCPPCDPPPCPPCVPCPPPPPCIACLPCQPPPPCKPCQPPCQPPPPCQPCRPCQPPPPCDPCQACQPPPPCEPCQACQPPPPCDPCQACQPPPPCKPCQPCQPPPPCQACQPPPCQACAPPCQPCQPCEPCIIEPPVTLPQVVQPSFGRAYWPAPYDYGYYDWSSPWWSGYGYNAGARSAAAWSWYPYGDSLTGW